MANNNPENQSKLPNSNNRNNSYITKSGSIHGDAPTRGPLTPLSGEDRRKAASLDLKINQQSTTGLPHGGKKFHEVFQWKQGRYADLPTTKISEMMKSNGLDNAPTQSLLSVVNGILDESFQRKNGEIPLRVACLLRKVVQEIERRISTQADHLRTQNSLFKIREEKYQSRIRVLEALATAENGEETKTENSKVEEKRKVENSKVEEKRKVENSTVEEKRKVENCKVEEKQNVENPKVEEKQKVENPKVEEKQKVENPKVEEKTKVEEAREYKRELKKEADKNIKEIASLKQELEMAKMMHEKRCLEMEKETEGVKVALQARLKELESLLADSNNRVKELEITTESKCQKWNMKVNIYQSYMDSQFSTMRELRLTSDAIKQELVKTQKSYFEEFNQLQKKVKELADMAGNYREVLAENRKLFNELQDLKGNIRVFCRVRPFIPGQSGNKTIVDSIGDNGQLVISNPSKPGKEGNKTFKFNKVFGPTATQVVDGFNVCIFAYGQTGSGKTYTMTGPNNATEEEWGVNYRALNNLFKISQNRRTTIVYEVGVQMIEIYNDQVRDLLAAKGSEKKYPSIKQKQNIYSCDMVIIVFLNLHTMGVTNISQPNGLAVPDASMHPVLSTTDVIDLIDIGFKNRTVSATAMNERSSRSHSIITVHVRGKDLKSANCLYGNLHLVDLAGSERVDRSEVTGDRLKEAQHINKSLSALGDVIFSLAQKGAHVPYRNSKLTQVLQSSLGGQAKTLMFVQLNPDAVSYTESLSTLKFAERVSGVELGAARSSKEGKDVRELMEQMASLKDTIAKKDEEIERLQVLKDLKTGYPSMDGEHHRTGSFSDKQSEAESQQSTDDEKSEISEAGLSVGTETEGSAEYTHSPDGSTPGKSKIASKIRLLQKPPQGLPSTRPEASKGPPGIKKSLSSNSIKPPLQRTSIRVFLLSRSHFLSSPLFFAKILKMYTSRKKIHKDKDVEPTEFEESVAQAFFDLENTNQDLKSDLKDLYINSAIQIDVSGSRKAVVIHVPYRLRKAFRKVHVKLVRELEKKFSGKDVILIATRRILRPPKKGSAVQRPRSRTLTAVHEAMLEDIVLPAEIVGKRIRYRIDGSKIMKVSLDPKERNNTEYKLETFSAVYRKLAGKDVVFEFPVTEA
ncbi:hypothetical protein V6N11_014977 [Hibiscus sabdariffa]|uniref:Kinesin motor domain-containing protein n=1 Tax=Hibiscus sabdariffa TaxID=183260 RepID=A0ABR2TRH9_9ROSI